jgi:hypothetical protein
VFAFPVASSTRAFGLRRDRAVRLVDAVVVVSTPQQNGRQGELLSGRSGAGNAVEIEPLRGMERIVAKMPGRASWASST